MSWTLAGITVHVDQDGAVKESLYSQQNVLDAVTTTLGFYGAKSETRSVRFTLILDTSGSGALETLKTAVQTDSDVTLVNDQGASSSVRIMKLSYDRVQALNHTLPVYACAAELVTV